MSVQFVEVNGVMIPTTEFVKNRERLEQAIKRETKNAVPTVINNEISDVKVVEPNIVPLEDSIELKSQNETVDTDVSIEEKDVPVKKVSGFSKISKK